MALLTAPFQNGPTGGAFNDVAQLASIFQRQQQAAQSQLDQTAREAARQEEARQRAQEAVLDGAMQELRRAAALKEKRAFDAANLSFKVGEANRDFGLKDRELTMKEADNAPFQLGPIPGSAAPVSGMPVTAPPASGFGASGGAGIDFGAGGGTGMTINATGYHPFDVKTEKERKMEGEPVDALGKPIRTLGSFKRGESDFVTVAVPQGSPLFGKTLTSPDHPGVTFKATDHFGTLGGEKVSGNKIDIAVDNRDEASRITGPARFVVADQAPPSAAAKAIADTRTQIEGMQSMGIRPTVKEARALALANAKTGERVDARASAPQPVKANIQDESGNLYTQFRDGSWKDGLAPEPGSKVFTIGAPGRPQTNGGELTYHDDGTVTTARGKVFHYEDNVLVPAHVPKGATAKQTLAGDDGEYYTQFSNGAWNTDDGLAPEGVKLTKLPGATEEARLDLRTEAQKATEKQRTVAALRSDRDHFDKLATDSQKALDKTAAELAKTPVVWPWQENGKWYKMVGKSKTSMPDAAAAALIADNKRKEGLIAEHSAKVAEYTKRSEEADSKLESFVRGDVPEKAPEAAPATGSAQPGATAGKPLDKATAAQLVQEAGGDKEKARALARERGYTF